MPFVFASPHSGRTYPDSFVAMSRLGPTSLRRSEDAFVDELFSGAVALGAPMIAARFPRAYLDANRAPAEIDTAMFDGTLPVAVDAPSPRVTAGLGVIPRIVRDGAEIYRAKLSPREAEERLTQTLSALSRRAGAADRGDARDFRRCRRDRLPFDAVGRGHPRYRAGRSLWHGRGTACDARSGARVREAGFQPSRAMRPMPAATRRMLYGRRDRDVHALQVEINRALYLDEERIERGPRFEQVYHRLTAALAPSVCRSRRRR